MLLLDENISPKLAAKLTPLFPGTVAVEQVQELGRGATDKEIWEYARDNELAIVTKDKDFALLTLTFGGPPTVILLATGNISSEGLEKIFIDREETIIRYLDSEHSNFLVLHRSTTWNRKNDAMIHIKE